jgi:dimethylhistidine N-methyltransferase
VSRSSAARRRDDQYTALDSTPPLRLAVHDDAPQRDEFRDDVLRGLSADRRTLPCKYFYDAHGAELFDRICELDEYYPTRTELGILEAHLPAIAARLGTRTMIIEFGSGSGIKTRMLLDQLDDPVAYVPIDISRAQLVETAHTLAAAYPRLEVLPVCADYTQAIELPAPSRPVQRRVVFFPGSTIGNFEPAEAARFLADAARLVGPDGRVLIGVDRHKDVRIIERAYNDTAGVTAAFNLNLLTRINRELGADFDVDRFSHRAVYSSAARRIEMQLTSGAEQIVQIAAADGSTAAFHFAEGDVIVTEHSYKYTERDFRTLAARASLQPDGMWSDPAKLFSVYLLRVGAAPS